MKKSLNTSALVTANNPKEQTNERPSSVAKESGYTLAWSVLGADFITPEEVTKDRLCIVYTNEQITALAESLPSEDILRWCKDNDYAVMPAPPTEMSMLGVRRINSIHFFSKYGMRWYTNEDFAHKDKTSFGWLIIKKSPVSNSTHRTWRRQVRRLSTLEKVPNAAEMSWFIITYFKIRGIRLFETINIRTSSLSSFGQHVYVGYFTDVCLTVDTWIDDDGYGDIGLSAARK